MMIKKSILYMMACACVVSPMALAKRNRFNYQHNAESISNFLAQVKHDFSTGRPQDIKQALDTANQLAERTSGTPHHNTIVAIQQAVKWYHTAQQHLDKKQYQQALDFADQGLAIQLPPDMKDILRPALEEIKIAAERSRSQSGSSSSGNANASDGDDPYALPAAPVGRNRTSSTPTAPSSSPVRRPSSAQSPHISPPPTDSESQPRTDSPQTLRHPSLPQPRDQSGPFSSGADRAHHFSTVHGGGGPAHSGHSAGPASSQSHRALTQQERQLLNRAEWVAEQLGNWSVEFAQVTNQHEEAVNNTLIDSFRTKKVPNASAPESNYADDDEDDEDEDDEDEDEDDEDF